MNARPRILAIDDTPENLVVLASALAGEFDFQLAASGPAGIELARKSPPALILLDVMMPEVDGYETCRRLKADPALADIPVIFVTALADMEAEINGLKLGAADFVTKPIKVELLRHRMRNILSLTNLTRDLRASEERLRLVMEATGDGVWDWDVASGMVVHNAAWCRMVGLEETQLVHTFAEHVARVHPEDLPMFDMGMYASLGGEDGFVREYRLQRQDGSWFWVVDQGKVVARGEDGAIRRMVGSIKDIDERKRNEAEIHRLAFFDTLTGLPNRRLLTDRLQQAIVKTQRTHDYGVVMFIDMDRFKELNDTHGHARGDLLLQEVAHRLQQCVRNEDTVARLGGDEFIVLLEHVGEDSTMAMRRSTVVGEKILEQLNRDYQLDGIQHHSTPSIGLTAFSGVCQDTVDSVLKRADIAMYAAKAAGRNTLSTIAPTVPA